MIKSEPILPLRFYNDIFDQDRFNKFHDRSFDTPLVYPTSQLPSFQFVGSASLVYPDNFVLKKVCNEDYHYKIIPENVSNFEPISTMDYFGGFNFAADTSIGKVFGPPAIYNDGVNPPIGVPVSPVVTFSCGKIVGGDITNYTPTSPPPPWTQLSVPVTNGYRHNVKIIVEKLVNVSTAFSIKIYMGSQSGTLIGIITKPGVYNTDFTANASNIVIVFTGYTAADAYSVSYLQVTKHPLISLGTGDLSIVPTKLKMFELENGKKVIAYCENNQSYNVDPGDYYYVVTNGLETFFSEVFTIKTLRELEAYYILSWWNSCDLGQIIYDETTLLCGFKNLIYLNAALFKPEYNTTTENLTNGENTLVPVFKKWQKYRTLDIVKTPEFLVDSLSGIFLHDNILLEEPLNREQVNRSSEFTVSEVISDITPVLEDGYQRVNLKMMLSENYVKSGCCENLTVEEIES